MPSNVAISVENLSKCYLVGHNISTSNQDNALRDVLARTARNLFRKTQDMLQGRLVVQGDSVEEFWALKDINFEIKRGDRVGIIGRNGAGKSTLLKVLSRITEPSSGRIKIAGRVASLLEVGTGFHPELSGRENIFLNGAILGMSRLEIQRKFDEIVDFAEVEQFLDTPVKRYSSGMYVRLAFSVAAHLEPEILIVDEVLAVGDAQFQKKCLGKMEDVGKEGRTVLFVSHQMAAIQRLCSSVIVLGNGQTKFVGDTRTAVDYYLQDLDTAASNANLLNMNRSGSGHVQLTSFSLENERGESVVAAESGKSIVLAFDYRCTSDSIHKNVSLGFSLHNTNGDTLVVFYSDYMGVTFDVGESGTIRCLVRDFPFSLGRYYVGVRILVNGVETDWPAGFVGVINVEAGDFYGDGNYGNAGVGPILIRGEWTQE